MLCSKCHQATEGLTDAGLCDTCFSEAEDRRLEIIEMARQERQSEGAVEIDDNAQLSEGTDNGCYVQAWVWVDFAGTQFDRHVEENG